MEAIGYGISPSYLSHWGGWEAYREVVQNFMDFGDYLFEENYHGCDGDKVTLHFKNNFGPEDLQFLGIGNSTKRGDSNSRGEHGEGLKMAMMVMLRDFGEDSIEIRTNGRRFVPYWDEIGGFGQSFCVCYESYDTEIGTFEVFMEFPTSYYKEFKDKVLTDKDRKFTCSYGSIVNRPKGQIYVGGLYVTTHKDLDNAYDFPPNSVTLGRDRDIPGEFDIRWNASRIFDHYLEVESDMTSKACDTDELAQDFVKETTEAMLSGDAMYINCIPSVLHDLVNPVITTNNEDGNDVIDFKIGNILLPERLRSIASGIDKVQNKVEKIKYKLKRRKSMALLLKEFKNKYEDTFNLAPTSMLVEFSELQQKAEKRGI